MVEPDTVFEVTDPVFDDGVSAMAGFQFEGVAVAVGHERVIGVLDEQGELRPGGGLDSATSAPSRKYGIAVHAVSWTPAIAVRIAGFCLTVIENLTLA